MWDTVLDALAAAAAWPWLAPLTDLAQAATAVLSLMTTAYRAIRFRDGGRDHDKA